MNKHFKCNIKLHLIQYGIDNVICKSWLVLDALALDILMVSSWYFFVFISVKNNNNKPSNVWLLTVL